MKHFWQEQGEKIRTILICSAIFLVMLSAIALLSSAVMRLFGFTYRSVGSIILFFLIATALSFPLCLVAGALPKALYEVGMLTSRKVALLLYLVLDTLASLWAWCSGLLYGVGCSRGAGDPGDFLPAGTSGRRRFAGGRRRTAAAVIAG